MLLCLFGSQASRGNLSHRKVPGPRTAREKTEVKKDVSASCRNVDPVRNLPAPRHDVMCC